MNHYLHIFLCVSSLQFACSPDNVRISSMSMNSFNQEDWAQNNALIENRHKEIDLNGFPEILRVKLSYYATQELKRVLAAPHKALSSPYIFFDAMVHLQKLKADFSDVWILSRFNWHAETYSLQTECINTVTNFLHKKNVFSTHALALALTFHLQGMSNFDVQMAKLYVPSLHGELHNVPAFERKELTFVVDRRLKLAPYPHLNRDMPDTFLHDHLTKLQLELYAQKGPTL